MSEMNNDTYTDIGDIYDQLEAKGTETKPEPVQEVSDVAEDVPAQEPSQTTEKAVQEANPADSQQGPAAPEWLKPEEKDAFSKLPMEAAALIAQIADRRNKEMDSDYTKKSQEVAEQRKAVEPVLKVMAKYDSFMKQQGVAPDAAIDRLAGVHIAMSQGSPAQKLALFAQLARDYGVDVSNMGAAVQSAVANQTNPELQALREVNERLMQEVSGLKNRFETQDVSRVQQTVEEFANAKDASGNLKYPFFSEVREYMSRIATDSSKLEDLYQEAVWAVPSVREKMLSQQEQERAKKEQKAADEARKAASVNAKPTKPVDIDRRKYKGPDAVRNEIGDIWDNLAGRA